MSVSQPSVCELVTRSLLSCEWNWPPVFSTHPWSSSHFHQQWERWSRRSSETSSTVYSKHASCWGLILKKMGGKSQRHIQSHFHIYSQKYKRGSLDLYIWRARLAQTVLCIATYKHWDQVWTLTLFKSAEHYIFRWANQEKPMKGQWKLRGCWDASHVTLLPIVIGSSDGVVLLHKHSLKTVIELTLIVQFTSIQQWCPLVLLNYTANHCKAW